MHHHYMAKAENLKSWIYVIIQFTCLGIIAVTGPIVANGIALAFEVVGILLGLWAIYVMKIGNLHITPAVGKNAKLTASGPYKLIRHPMYTGLLLVSLGMVFSHMTTFRLIVWLILLANLLLKLHFEEGLLLQKMNGYKKYRKTSFRLVPYIY